ncbi:MAG: transporter substrate-binding domain-containing protein [Kouleothrix sp.]
MREDRLDAWRHRWRDLAAWAVLLGYALLAVITQLGANLGGQGLDPVWAAARRRGSLRVVDFGYYPFSALEHGQPVGYDIDLARAIGQRQELASSLSPASNLDSISTIGQPRPRHGRLAFPYAPEQGWRAGFSSFYFNAGQVLVVPAGASIAGQDQLGGHTLGAALDSDADTYAPAGRARPEHYCACSLRHAGRGDWPICGARSTRRSSITRRRWLIWAMLA